MPWFLAAVIGFLLGLAGQPLLKVVEKKPQPKSQSEDRPLTALPPMPGPGLSVMAIDARLVSPSAVDLSQLNQLFTRVWGAPKPNYEQVLGRSFAWVMVYRDGKLLGFANVAWDGGPNFFLLDVSIDPSSADEDKIFTDMIEAAVQRCRKEGGSMRVDAPEELLKSYFQPLGFKPVSAAVINLPKGSAG